MNEQELKEMAELGDVICEFCPYKKGYVNHSLGRPCEGDYCEDAYENYMEEQDNEV